MGEKSMRVFRSRIQEFPIDLRTKIIETSLQKGIQAPHRKSIILNALKEYNIDFLEVGTGTNRFVIKYDGYAIKFALDKEGVADNRQEWVMSDLLSPHVSYAYEISKGGHILVEEYIPAFTSYSEFCEYSSSVRKILTNWGSRFLLGDVGIKHENYGNWGLSPEGKAKCIDYAYIFPAAMDLFKCICGNKTMTFYDTTCSSYKCTVCGKRYEDREIRAKISQEERLRLFEKVSGIEMHAPIENHLSEPIYDPVDNNPDLPNIYEATYQISNRMLTGKSNNWW